MRITIYADFVCPFCYMNRASIEKVKAQEEVEIVWRAFELRPGGVLPPPERAALIAEKWPLVQERGRGYGIELRTFHFGVDSRPAHRAFKIVERVAPGRADAFGLALHGAYFGEDRDIGDVEVLVELATAHGVDGALLRERLIAGDARDEVVRDEDAAAAGGVTSIPTLIFEDGREVKGPLPADELIALIQELRSQRAQVGA